MKIKTIIVDDEPLSRDGIKLRLSKFEDIHIIGEYGSGCDAVLAINSYLPDLVFLDIQMPEMDGFEVIKNITANPLPFIIFVTAYDKYALKAFEVHALDYLLKPINDTRFDDSITRVKEEIINKGFLSFESRIKSLILEYSQSKTMFSAIEYLPETKLERIAVKSKNGYSFINSDEIDWVEAAGDYVYLHNCGKKILHRATMHSIEELLDPTKFQRIHRSIIVNMNKIKEIQPADHGDFYVYLFNGSKVKLSRNYKDKFLSLLKITI